MSDDLGLAQILGADAIGQPGQRRFRLYVRTAHSSAILWMEKVQLDGLAVALDRSLALITEGQILRTEARAGEQERATPEEMPADFPSYPTYDFQAAQMSLNFSEADTLFQLSVVPLDENFSLDQEEETPTFVQDSALITFAFTPQQAQNLSSAILVLLSAGRPVCPFCHTPLDGGPHACVKQNGHRKILRIEEAHEDDNDE